MAHTFTSADEGKEVLAGGQYVGIVVETDAERAFVEPEPSISQSLMARLGWGEADEDAYPINGDAVAAVTDDEIRLSTPMESGQCG